MIFDERDPRQKREAELYRIRGASGSDSVRAMADMNDAAMQLFADSCGGFRKAAAELRRLEHAKV